MVFTTTMTLSPTRWSRRTINPRTTRLRMTMALTIFNPLRMHNSIISSAVRLFKHPFRLHGLYIHSTPTYYGPVNSPILRKIVRLYLCHYNKGRLHQLYKVPHLLPRSLYRHRRNRRRLYLRLERLSPTMLGGECASIMKKTRL